jgi:hypothetical protein
LSPDLAWTTLQGVVQQSVYVLYDDIHDPILLGDERCFILQQLHTLVWRMVQDLHLIPPRRVLETLCNIDLVVATYSYTGDSRDQGALASVVLLLTGWYEWWTADNESAFGLATPPSLYLRDLLEFAIQHKVPMSPDLWNLYMIAHSQRPPRVVYSLLLNLMRDSTSEWKALMTCVLQDMTYLAEDPFVDPIDYHPTADELFQVLEIVASSGQVQKCGTQKAHHGTRRRVEQMVNTLGLG